jgi:type VI secretion system secreted protein Hcp
MSVDAFLKMDIKGESVVDGHEEEVQIHGVTWGMMQTGTTHKGTGGGAGKVDVGDLSFSHNLDTATPNLVLACCSGKHFEEAVITFRKAGETPLDYVVLTMHDVIVTSYAISGQSGDDLVKANGSLNFASFVLSYQPQDNKGAKAGGAVEAEYDIAKVK